MKYSNFRLNILFQVANIKEMCQILRIQSQRHHVSKFRQEFQCRLVEGDFHKERKTNTQLNSRKGTERQIIPLHWRKTTPRTLGSWQSSRFRLLTQHWRPAYLYVLANAHSPLALPAISLFTRPNCSGGFKRFTTSDMKTNVEQPARKFTSWKDVERAPHSD